MKIFQTKNMVCKVKSFSYVLCLLYYRLSSPPVQGMELNLFASQSLDLSHDYEDIRRYSELGRPPAIRPRTGDPVPYSEVAVPAGKPTPGDGVYDIVKPPVPIGWATMSGDGYEVVDVPVGRATANGDGYKITKCPAYVPLKGQDQSSELEEGSTVYTNKNVEEGRHFNELPTS